jgi:voltage-gated potassium channel
LDRILRYGGHNGMKNKIKSRIYEILEGSVRDDKAHRAFEIFIVTLITTNVVAVMMETERAFHLRYAGALRTFDIISVAIFTIEYLLRIWVCTNDPKFKGPISGRVRFALSPLALIDIMAILPFYLPLVIPFDLRILRAVRLIRLARLLKIGRYSEALKLFGRVLKAKKEELIAALFILFILLIVSASLLYYVENPAQPEKFSSIPASMWWGVVTLTTVGYGDIYPITPLGKFLGAIISLLGIGFFAMPAGLLSAGFIEEIKKKRMDKKCCPKCGENIE